MQLDLAVAKAAATSLKPADELVERFRRGLDRLVKSDQKIGVAVSGGPDSLALLLLAAAARPGQVEGATVDHALRDGSRAEAEMVGSLCGRLGVPHAILTVEWSEKPETAIQERARTERYKLLGRWGRDKGLNALATAHHVDDQAETFLMRLARGAGVRGLGAMRPRVPVPGTAGVLVRPLLNWCRAELEQICADVGLAPAADPSNEDEQFERVRVRKALAVSDWLDPLAIARSAAHLAQAEAALDWATDMEWGRSVKAGPNGIVYAPRNAPLDIRRRIVRRAVLKLATEGLAELRGNELDRLVAELSAGRQATLRGVLCRGGTQWQFVPAPNRSRPVDKMR